jgi:hypothetical protein
VAERSKVNILQKPSSLQNIPLFSVPELFNKPQKGTGLAAHKVANELAA